MIGIALCGLLSALIVGTGWHLPLLVAPMGASAVLLFAVPASPLAQPWSIIGGNTLSALVGVLVAMAVPNPVLAAGIAVALAILVMSLTRSLHPPGGAAALTAVFGGPTVAAWGLLFPLIPVALNSCILVALGILFHRLAKRKYPHQGAAPAANTHGTADQPASIRVGFQNEDIDAALSSLNESFDIDRDDLGRVLREIELQTVIRVHSHLTCADIMSRDVITVKPDETRERARSLLFKHNVRLLPVTDDAGRLLGTVGLRELTGPGSNIAGAISPAKTVSSTAPAYSLLPTLTDGRTHAVIVTDDAGKVIGLISQTDLLSAMGRLAFTREQAPRPASSRTAKV